MYDVILLYIGGSKKMPKCELFLIEMADWYTRSISEKSIHMESVKRLNVIIVWLKSSIESHYLITLAILNKQAIILNPVQ